MAADSLTAMSSSRKSFTLSLHSPEGEKRTEQFAMTSFVRLLALKEAVIPSVRTPSSAESTVSGIACVYGTYYYVTEHSYYGVAEEGAREFTRSGTAMPVAITSDMYGNLYVASSTGQVIRFTESEFLDYSFSGIPVTDSWVLPSSFSSLRPSGPHFKRRGRPRRVPGEGGLAGTWHRSGAPHPRPG